MNEKQMFELYMIMLWLIISLGVLLTVVIASV